MARRFATRIRAIRANRFPEKPLFSQRARDSRESPQTCDLQFFAPGARFANKGFSSGTLKRFARIERFARIFTLPALQKSFVNIFFVFAWEFCIEKWRGFLVNFFWSPSPTKRSTKSPRKIRGKFGAKFGAKNSGRKFEKFGKLSFCNFSDPTNLRIDSRESGHLRLGLADKGKNEFQRKPLSTSPLLISIVPTEGKGRLQLKCAHMSWEEQPTRQVDPMSHGGGGGLKCLCVCRFSLVVLIFLFGGLVNFV